MMRVGRMPPVRVDLGEGAERRISQTAHELITGHGAPLYVFTSGFIAGVLLWIPIFAIFFLNRLMSSSSGARVGVYGGGLGIDPAALVPYMIATGLLGVGLAILRRTSARIGWYKEVASQRLGLNGAVASVLGALVCIGLIASGSQLGIILVFISVGVLFGGYILNSAWEALHNLLLIPYGARQSDLVLERAIRHELQRQSDIRPTRLEGLSVLNGKVTLAAEWETSEARREAQEALQSMEGVTIVQFEKVA